MLGGMAICPATAALVERRIPLHRVLPSPRTDLREIGVGSTSIDTEHFVSNWK